ncbi:MAG: FG-GAP repeat protein, partial [Myxococcales bacterium]|nr:FG-GAP repeat protein [Myxococcales bacterium]
MKVVGGSGGVVNVEGRQKDVAGGAIDTERVVFHDGSAITGLVTPGVPSAQELGRSIVAFGEGSDTVRIFGSPGAADPAVGAESGRLDVLHPSGSWTPLDAHAPSHGTGDRVGSALAVGDFDGDGWDDLAVAAAHDSRPSTLEGFASTCGAGSVARGGSVAVFLSDAGDLPAEPSFVVYGSTPSGTVRGLIGGFDHDGDDRADLAIAFGGSTPTVAIVDGRPAGAGIVEICPDEVYTGPAGADLGSALAVLGRVDGDACDAIAIGARLEDAAVPDEGAVYVLWGAGSGCTATAPQISHITSGVPASQAGAALAGGFDLTGDGEPDLAVGGPERGQSGVQTGAVWVAQGSWLSGLDRAPASGTTLPT